MFLKKNLKVNRSGISLIELMIMVLVIAILGSVTYPHMLKMSLRSREASVKSNMFTLRVAAENFASMAEGWYPEEPEFTVSQVLIAMGYAGAINLSLIADVCPGTRLNVATTVNALLPGNNTYGNPFWPYANSLDELGAVVAPGPGPPGHIANPGVAASGQGTVYFGPVGTGGAIAMEGYVIYGDGYNEVLEFELRSGQ